MARSTEEQVESRLGEMKGVVYSIVRQFTRRRDVDDAAQEAMLALWQLLKEAPNASRALMLAVARRRAISSLYYGRSVDSWVLRPRPFFWEILSIDEPQGPDGEPFSLDDELWRSRGRMPLSPVEDVALARVELSELMAGLPPRQQTFLALRLQGYTTGEIAPLMGITPDAACGLLIRIREKAMTVLEEDGAGYRRRGRRPWKGTPG